jgi:hypothetical protein
MSTSEQVNFVFRHQPQKSSKSGVLLAYINEDGAQMSRSERVLRPLAAFWLPFAYQHCTEASWQEVQQLARSAVYQLKLHVQYLEDSFGLNSSPAVSEVTQSQEKQLFANGWRDSQNFDEIEDFSQEDEILSQFT